MYTRIYKKESFYQIRFRHPKTKEETWVTFKTMKEAINKANEIDVDYHTENPGELPKGITLDKPNNRFRFHVRLQNETNKHIRSSKSLEKVVETRNHLLKNLLSLF